MAKKGEWSARLVADFNPKLIDNMKGHGLWCCHVLTPPCGKPPHLEICDPKGTRSLRCEAHGMQSCMAHNIPFPSTTNN